MGGNSALWRPPQRNLRQRTAHHHNRMELTAAIEGLRMLKEPCAVQVVTDSEYVKNGITQWLAGWKRKGWMGSLASKAMT